MAAEFHIVFDDPTWYARNKSALANYIQSLKTFRQNINDQEYWLRGSEAGGDWSYGVRIFVRPHDVLLEISSHPPSLIDDIKKLNEYLTEHTKIMVIDDDGQQVDGYSV